MVGSRAKVYVDDVLVGIFESCQRGVNIGAEPLHTLGRYSANEIAVNSYEAVQVNCSGFRIIGQGVHVLPKAPQLQDLLNLERVKLDVVDRQSGERTMTVVGCVPINWGEADQAKATTRLNVTYIGLVLSDEEGDQDESPGASTFPA